ncbi:MAG: ParB/RepB/Spo0J family partition protein [Phycisphaerae bacterium]|nr:ParB/RepB/Spo0J family partition protein [Phycisphaerae bacterium]
MKEKRPHLGRGLEALLGPIVEQSELEPTPPIGDARPTFPPDKEAKEAASNIPIDKIKPNPYQPRSFWNEEELKSLADSIKLNGLLQPILVRRIGDEYQIIAGERRYRAAKLAGLTSIQVLNRPATDQQMLELALVENIHRADLNPIERATAYQNFISSFSLTHAEAAERLGQDRSVITNYLRLLDLPLEIKQMLVDHQLSMGHARAILAIPNDDLRRKIANRAMAGHLSVREVERIVRRYANGEISKKKVQDTTKSPHISDLEKRLQEVLGTKVQIRSNQKSHRGRIIIDFYSIDEFERIANKMGLVSTD